MRKRNKITKENYKVTIPRGSEPNITLLRTNPDAVNCVTSDRYKYVKPQSMKTYKIAQKVQKEPKLPEGPPTGTVPDPNNPKNVLVCHYNEHDDGYVTTSVPIKLISQYTTYLKDYDGKCVHTRVGTCMPGAKPDCKGICGGKAVLDCAGHCYDPSTEPTLNLKDCAGNCYPAHTDPPFTPDCKGVCGGTNYCCDMCDKKPHC